MWAHIGVVTNMQNPHVSSITNFGISYTEHKIISKVQCRGIKMMEEHKCGGLEGFLRGMNLKLSTPENCVRVTVDGAIQSRGKDFI